MHCTEMIMTKQKKATAKKPANSQRAPAKPTAKPTSKLGRLEAMLRRPDGATIEQLSKALDWQAHSVRGAMSGALRRNQTWARAPTARPSGLTARPMARSKLWYDRVNSPCATPTATTLPAW